MKRLVILFTFLVVPFSLLAQETFPVNGVKDKDVLYHAFTKATIVNYKDTLKNATLLIRKGKIEQIGANVSLPKGCVVHDLKDKYIYPSFVDPFSSYGVPKPEKKKGNDGPQFVSNKKGAFSWNEALKPEVKAAELFTPNAKAAEELRKIGFGAVSTIQTDGIARGTSALVLLGEGKENELLVKEKSAAHYSFRKGTSTQDNPSSLMGAIALLRQTYLDADWYKKNEQKKEINLSLEAWNKNQNIPQIFEVKDLLEALRADKVGDEFNVQYVIKGAGDEYKRVKETKATNATFIIPLAFPKPYEVGDPYEALYLDLADMKHWELAPSNPFFLHKENVPFAFTTDGLENKNFFKNVQKAIKYGLPQEEALKALTLNPAKLLGVENELGAVKVGMKANFIITSKPVFEEKCIIYENWVDGKPYIIDDIGKQALTGKYDLTIAKKLYKLEISTDKDDKTKARIVVTDKKEIKVGLSISRQNVSLSFSPDSTIKENILLSGTINGKNMSGKGQLTDGTWIDWKATYTGELKEKEIEKGLEKEKTDSTKVEEISVGEIWYPFAPYGSKEQLKQEDVLIQNATVWTNEADGVLENADVLIIGGKIEAIGKGLTPPKKGKVIDAKGKHVTSGIIDEHSHIAISKGVNEGSQSSSAEVSISHVINSEDVNLYRQLAGGVTAAQLLHGSANAIGGQSGIVKFRWGKSPEEMKIKGADGFIKFALGENVKQSNWGDDQTKRFPQTRMGVEQVYYDHFIQAKEYQKERAQAPNTRKDLEMEALSEILNKKRFITCHSYVQSEINMLMHVGDSMGFTVNTFTHILEGYKVADKMKKHGAGGSTFSDWWAYKFEVNDAIPYNAAMMHRAGVLTAINSDDAEMARRLNQEAAKAVKYGSASEEDAWKMVTLNPAKLLHLDDRMGSIKKGKDADIVIWSDHPLSIYAKAEKTYVDGVCYFDIERDEQLREEIKKERNRLIQKMIKAKEAGEETQKAEKKEEKLYHCDTMLDEY